MTRRLRLTALLTLVFVGAALLAGLKLNAVCAGLFFAFFAGAYAAVFVYSLPDEGDE